MNRIELLNDRLLKQPKLYIDVFDPQNQDFIERNLTAEMILKNHSSLTDYYKSFHSKGFSEIGIIAKKKNGTSFINKELPITVSLQPENKPDPTFQKQDQQQNNNSDNVQFESLGTGKREMSLDKYIDLNYTEKEHTKLVSEHKELKTKYSSEKKKRKKYQKMFEKISTKSFLETPTGEKAIGIIESLGATFLEKRAVVNGLGGGQQQPTKPDQLAGLSDDKIAFVSQVLKSPKLKDEALQPLSMVAVGLSNSEDFTAALSLLLEEYELTPQ